ncbi:phage tail protein [Bradyrhizobium sp. BRP05]|nr:phage tail protein [Bradyrhizobium sp. BRP05]
MASVLMGLGSLDPKQPDNQILFYVPIPTQETPGFETLQRDAQYTWVSNDRLSRDPAMQFTGPGEENITVEGRMFPYHFGGLSTLERLRAAGRAGKPYILVRFYPLKDELDAKESIADIAFNKKTIWGCENLGNFVIKRVRTVESKIGAVGIAMKIDFTLELTRYGDDLISVTPGDVGIFG